MKQPVKKRLTPAEAKAREERLRAAGLRPRGEKTSVVTTLLATRLPVEHTPEDDCGRE